MADLNKLDFRELLANREVYKPQVIANSLPIMNKRQGVERALADNADVIDPVWTRRHAKLIYRIGYNGYERLAITARKKDNPVAYMAFLVNKEMKG